MNIKTQKDYFNKNPACSASLDMYEWQRRGFVYHTNPEAHVNSRWFSASASQHDPMNSQAVRITSWKLYHFIWEN